MGRTRSDEYRHSDTRTDERAISIASRLVARRIERHRTSVQTTSRCVLCFPDVSRISKDSREAAETLLNRANVATVPGIVFGGEGEGHLRFSFSTSIETIEAGLDSLRRNL